MLRHTANAIPFATLIASPSSQHSCKSTHKAFTIVSIKVHQENTEDGQEFSVLSFLLVFLLHQVVMHVKQHVAIFTIFA